MDETNHQGVWEAELPGFARRSSGRSRPVYRGSWGRSPPVSQAVREAEPFGMAGGPKAQPPKIVSGFGGRGPPIA